MLFHDLVFFNVDVVLLLLLLLLLAVVDISEQVVELFVDSLIRFLGGRLLLLLDDDDDDIILLYLHASCFMT